MAPRERKEAGLAFLMVENMVVDQKVDAEASPRTRARKEAKEGTKANNRREKDMAMATIPMSAGCVVSKATGEMSAH